MGVAIPTRRGFLGGFTALSAVAGGTVLTIAAKADPLPDAELLQFGRDLDVKLAAYRQCCVTKAERVEYFRTIEPPIPQEIVRAHRGTVPWWGDAPPDPDGRANHKLFNHRIMILYPYEAAKLVRQTDGRTREGKLYRHMKRFADDFAEAHAAAREVARVDEAECERYQAGREVIDLGFKIAALTAETLPGLAVKGRSGLAMHEVWSFDEGRHCELSYRKLLENLVALSPVA